MTQTRRHTSVSDQPSELATNSALATSVPGPASRSVIAGLTVFRRQLCGAERAVNARRHSVATGNDRLNYRTRVALNRQAKLGRGLDEQLGDRNPDLGRRQRRMNRRQPDRLAVRSGQLGGNAVSIPFWVELAHRPFAGINAWAGPVEMTRGCRT